MESEIKSGIASTMQVSNHPSAAETIVLQTFSQRQKSPPFPGKLRGNIAIEALTRRSKVNRGIRPGQLLLNRTIVEVDDLSLRFEVEEIDFLRTGFHFRGQFGFHVIPGRDFLSGSGLFSVC
jgi:hypothetical protein